MMNEEGLPHVVIVHDCWERRVKVIDSKKDYADSPFSVTVFHWDCGICGKQINDPHAMYFGCLPTDKGLAHFQMEFKDE